MMCLCIFVSELGFANISLNLGMTFYLDNGNSKKKTENLNIY